MIELVSEEYGTSGLVTCCLCAVICTIAPIVLTTFMGIYAFANPDKDAWYGFTTDEKP